MNSDRHEVFRQRIDRALAGEILPQEQESLREHLQSCAECQGYLSSGTRAIASLSGFSFDVDPALQAKVIESIRMRAPQVSAQHPSGMRIAGICLIAFLLTAVGSIVDLQFGGLVASALDLQRTQIQQGLLLFWIIPSLSLLLVFPLLPLISAAVADRKGRIL